MKKQISLMLSLAMLTTVVSCSKNEDELQTEIFNNNFYAAMDSEAFYISGTGNPGIVDFATLKTGDICNIPNCNHTVSSCIVSSIKTSGNIPTVYNNSAYYFMNISGFTDKDGKRALDLNAYVMKYDFSRNETEKIADIEGINANTNGGAYLVGDELYFIANFGNPKYDEAGNVKSSSGGGGGNLYSINLGTAEVTDYGEIFDYEALKEEYPVAAISTSTNITGKIGDELYLSTGFLKEELGGWCGFTYAFNPETRKYKKVNDCFSVWNSNGWCTYMENGILYYGKPDWQEFKEGSAVTAFNNVSVLDDRIWHESMCYDIETGIEKNFTDLNFGVVIAKYEGNYIVKGEDSDGNIIFEKIPCEEIDSLFE